MNIKINKLIYFILAVLVAIIIIFPLYWLFIGSIQKSGDIFAYPPNFIPEKVNLNNFLNLFERDIPFYTYFFNSVYTVFFHVLGVLVFSSMAGFALAKYNFRGKNLIFSVIIAGMLIPFQALIIPLFLVSQKLGIFDNRIALFLPFFAQPFAVFLMRQYMLEIPDSLMEAARIDGASELRIFWQIVTPIIKPAFAAVAIVDFVAAWNAFVWPLTILRTQSKFTLPIWLNALIKDPYVVDYGMMFAAALITVLPILIAFLFLQKQFISGLAAGAED
jgi:ABC-type glycerol-3-phosphate transport system permease component